MGTTTRGLPFPEPSDLVTQGAAAIEALAEAVDSMLPAAGSNVAVTTDVNGQFTVNHGLGRTPKAGFTRNGTGRMGVLVSATSTTATFNMRAVSDGALWASSSGSVDWFAF